MKILRAITQRGYSVGTAGYFSVLRHNTWFAATRLPGPFRYRAGKPVMVPAETAAPNIITLPPEQRRPLRQALILLISGAVVLAMLLWIMHPNFR